jgi:hypothetical protein
MLVAGCKANPPAMPDLAAAPADLAVSGCQPDFGKVFFVSHLAFLGSGMGFDLNGDGVIDNRLGFIAPLANPNLTSSIAAGDTIMLVSITGLSGDSLVDGEVPQIAVYLGIDADSPPNPSNNAMNGQFRIPIEQFDVSCKPARQFDQVVIKNGVLSATAKEISITVATIGTLSLENVHLTMTADPGLTGVHGRVGAVGSDCSLSLTPFPGPNPQSILDVMINQVAIQGDIDVDGDGLEVLVGDGTTIAECIDGPGPNADGGGAVIPGRNCPCDPRIADGYSEATEFDGVPAQILGVSAGQ